MHNVSLMLDVRRTRVWEWKRCDYPASSSSEAFGNRGLPKVWKLFQKALQHAPVSQFFSVQGADALKKIRNLQFLEEMNIIDSSVFGTNHRPSGSEELTVIRLLWKD